MQHDPCVCGLTAVAYLQALVADHTAARGAGLVAAALSGPPASPPGVQGLSWEDTAAFLAGIQSLCAVEDLTIQTHQVGRALVEKYQLSVYDAMIVSAALIAGCTTLWSEDMHDGLLVEDQLRVVNPFS